jgi:hypothetical protein
MLIVCDREIKVPTILDQILQTAYFKTNVFSR